MDSRAQPRDGRSVVTESGTILRVGWISYANTLPLKRAIQDAPGISVEEGPPSRLNRLLSSGAIDLAPISSIEFARHRDSYVLLPGLSISADGPVQSVLVTSDRPLLDSSIPGDTAIHLSPASATSVVLLKVLARFFWPTTLRLRFTRDLKRSNARLLIGDEALREYLHPTAPYHVDLAEEWRVHTGLPLVFALFCVPREALSDRRQDTLLAIHRSLTEAALAPDRAWGAREAARRLGLSEEDVLCYLNGLCWNLSDRHEQGLATFFDLASRLGEAPAVATPRASILAA